jgi:hypothetical protein
MIAAVRQLATQGQLDKATKLSVLAAELYPGLDTPNVYAGIMTLVSGDKEKGKEFVKRGAAINGNGIAGAGGLNGLAYEMAGAGLVDGALAVVQMASELYPQEANLYDSIADFEKRNERQSDRVLSKGPCDQR